MCLSLIGQFGRVIVLIFFISGGDFKARASGKTTIVASTEGNVTIPNREEKVGLNVYRKK